MDFDLNDPLGDILSDDDSFFNDDKYKTSSKTNKSPALDIHAKKTNIFGLDNEPSKNKEPENIAPSTQTSIKPESDWLGLIDSTPTTPKVGKKSTNTYFTSTKAVVSKQNNNFKSINDGNDILESLGLPDDLHFNKPVSKTTKENVTLDEILNNPIIGQQKPRDDSSNLFPKKDSSQAYTPSISTGIIERKAQDKKIHSFSDHDTKKISLTSREVSKNTVSLANQNTMKNDKKDLGIGTTRRQKEKKDWLGLLQDEDEEIFDTVEIPKKKTFSELLSLNENKNANVITDNKNISALDNNSIINKTESKQIVNNKNVETHQSHVDDVVSKPKIPDLGNTIISNLSMNYLDIEKNSAALCVQQQESHLLVALQLKAQEERLASMHEKQEETRRIQNEVVKAHKEQQDCILHGIKENQQRINNHIKTLLYRGDDVETYAKNNEKEINHEKDHMEYIITILKENHEKEIEILHSSHQRQINSITESLITLEERYKNDQETLTQYCNSKIKILEEENLKLSEKYETTIKHILEKQLIERDRTENKHFNDIEILQKQHEIIIKNIRDAYAQEQSTINETKDYSIKLNAVLSDVEKNSEMCEKIMGKLESITINNIDIRQKAVEIKEEQINKILENLEKQREMYNEEALKTKNVLSLIEERLNQHTQILDEEKSLLKHKQNTFEIEQDKAKRDLEMLKNQFDFEKDIFKKNCENTERARCDEKLSIDENIKKLEKEKYSILEDKKIISIMKSECQELKNKLILDVDQLNEKRKMLQQESDRISEEEMRILQRSRELEILSRSAVTKQKIAENKISEANFAQKQYEEKLCKIQEYSLSLNSREQQIAKDKISLSKERLLLYNEQRSIIVPKRFPHFKNENFSRLHDLETQNIYSNYFIDKNISKDINSDDILGNNIKMINFNINGGKDIKDGFNTLEQINNLEEQVSFKGDYKEKLPIIFQDIVDPKIMAMKLDISNYTTNSSIDLETNIDQYNFAIDNL